MKKLITFCLSIFLLTGCVYVSFHDYAEINKDVAAQMIKRLKNDTLVVVIPTYANKERLLKAAYKKSRDKKRLKQSILNLYAEQRVEQEAVVYAFSEYYSFSEVLFIPDSLVYSLEMGEQRAFFINEKGRIDPSITLKNRAPIKLIKQFDEEWQVKIKNKMIPSPFPNYYSYANGLSGFMAPEKYDRVYKRVASAIQKRFERFYDKPGRRIFL